MSCNRLSLGQAKAYLSNVPSNINHLDMHCLSFTITETFQYRAYELQGNSYIKTHGNHIDICPCLNHYFTADSSLPNKMSHGAKLQLLYYGGEQSTRPDRALSKRK